MMTVLISGCGSSDGSLNDILVAPTVIATNPVDAAINVERNHNVIANFSTVMNASTITTSTFTLTGPGMTPVAGAVSYAGTTATFNPAVTLDGNTTYTATITTGVKNAAGTALAANHVWTFTTGTIIDSTAPIILATNPDSNATGIAISQNITAIFSEALDPTTVTATTFTVTGPGATPVDGNVSYVGTTATFNPTADLAASTLYTVTLTTGITDLAVNSLAANHVWTFTTGTGIIAANPTAPVLGEAGRFVLLARTLISTTGTTAISNGDIGITPYARTFMTGFTLTQPAGDGHFDELTGSTWVGMDSMSYAPDDANPAPFPYPLAYAAPHAVYTTTSAMLTQSSTDWGVAATFLAADPNPGAPTQVCPTELGTQVLTRGVYKTASSVTISTGPLHLDAQGDPTAVFIFNIGGTLTTGASGSIILDNGALAKNVYWRTGNDTTIAASTTFFGNVFSTAQVVVLSGANITGSLFAETQINLTGNNVTKAQ